VSTVAKRQKVCEGEPDSNLPNVTEAFVAFSNQIVRCGIVYRMLAQLMVVEDLKTPWFMRAMI
jgi:hypothetical protein